MRVKVSEAIGPVLDYMVEVCEGADAQTARQYWMGLGWDPANLLEQHKPVPYSTDWQAGGPILAQEKMEFDYDEWQQIYGAFNGVHGAHGKTHLEAAMRCYVASKLGDTVEVPDELA
jgi:hypothetical protein